MGVPEVRMPTRWPERLPRPLIGPALAAAAAGVLALAGGPVLVVSSLEAGDAPLGPGVVYGFALTGLGLALVGVGVLRRRRPRRPPELVVPMRGLGPRLVFRADDRTGWQVLAWAGVGAACLLVYGAVLVVAVVDPLGDGLSTGAVGIGLGPATIGLAAAVTSLMIDVPRWRRPTQRLAVDTDGFTVRRGEAEVHLEWSVIRAVSAGCYRFEGAPYALAVVIEVIVTDPPQVSQEAAERVGVLASPAREVIVPTGSLDQHPAVLLAALDHYHRHPGERDDLAEHHWPAEPPRAGRALPCLLPRPRPTERTGITRTRRPQNGAYGSRVTSPESVRAIPRRTESMR